MKFSLLIVLVFLSPATLVGQDIGSLIFQARSAVGTEGDIAKVRSISVSADCVGPKGTYTTEIASFRSSKTRFTQRFTYKADVVDVFVNGDSVWSAGNGIATVASSMQRMVAHAHEYQMIAFDFQRYFRDLKIVGIESFEGRPNTKVTGLNELGMTTNLFFDAETRRFSGYVLEIPNSTETVRNVVLEWKQVGKLTLPSVVKAVDSQGEWTLRFQRIQLNKANESQFAIPQPIADHMELLRLHEEQKTAHLSYDADKFIAMFADKVTQLQNGRVLNHSPVESLERFKKYFASYRFKEWEDTAPPVIKISKDGTLAYKIVQKRVRGTYTYDDGKKEDDHTVFAWMEVWEKINGKWKVTAVASTSRNGDR